MVRLSIIAFAVKPRVSLIKFRKGGHARMDRTERLSSVSTVSCRKEWLCNNDSIKRVGECYSQYSYRRLGVAKSVCT
ncbi:PREDICTED: uncharacterized protein LOC108972073 isoform X3 [Bactrocera latifrons]|uniref:uncharacterized protein LOC108972073 isoform X3 n=1 Tax=Bactrocera latifrons TaxID=174628 RepID=UPI0008DE3501|nr:PREDICTED: uncharacterized protein LOC108972073 isoform X3 [Bactrocera latifrons]